VELGWPALAGRKLRRLHFFSRRNRSMARIAFVLCASVLALVAGLAAAADAPKPAAPAHRLSGPYTHGNLTIFLIHGEDQLKGKTFLTLDEAIEQKKVVVHETKNVNQLSIENKSADAEVFIAAGDIVKGGQQDRVLALDLVLPPNSKPVAIASFCVEAGRWRQRGGEEAATFSGSKEQLATKDLKIAARASVRQDEVWKEVRQAQMRLARNVGAPVQDARSETSLQLTLEHKKLLEAVDGHVKELAPLLKDKKDVIGFAFAINGQVNSSDVYASSELFRKLWPKLLKATAVEAVAELKKDKTFPAVTAEKIQAFLADAEKGKSKEKEISKRLQQIQKESEKNFLFETVDREHGVRLRCNCIAR
jgi:hypothetical protein